MAAAVNQTAGDIYKAHTSSISHPVFSSRSIHHTMRRQPRRKQELSLHLRHLASLPTRKAQIYDYLWNHSHWTGRSQIGPSLWCTPFAAPKINHKFLRGSQSNACQWSGSPSDHRRLLIPSSFQGCGFKNLTRLTGHSCIWAVLRRVPTARDRFLWNVSLLTLWLHMLYRLYQLSVTQHLIIKTSTTSGRNWPVHVKVVDS